jgi:hypothetical protein
MRSNAGKVVVARVVDPAVGAENLEVVAAAEEVAAGGAAAEEVVAEEVAVEGVAVEEVAVVAAVVVAAVVVAVVEAAAKEAEAAAVAATEVATMAGVAAPTAVLGKVDSRAHTQGYRAAKHSASVLE